MLPPVLLLAATAGPGVALPVDLTVTGVLVSVIGALLRLWWVERTERQQAQQAHQALTERAVAALTEGAGTTRDLAAAVDRLTDEVRRR